MDEEVEGLHWVSDLFKVTGSRNLWLEFQQPASHPGFFSLDRA